MQDKLQLEEQWKDQNEQYLQPDQSPDNDSQLNKDNQLEVSIKTQINQDQVKSKKILIQSKVNQLRETLIENTKNTNQWFQFSNSRLIKFNFQLKKQTAIKQFVTDLKQFCKTISLEYKELITELKIQQSLIYSYFKDIILKHLFVAFPKLSTININKGWFNQKYDREYYKIDLNQYQIKQQCNLKHAKQLKQIIKAYLKTKIEREKGRKNMEYQYFDYQNFYYIKQQSISQFLQILSQTKEQIRSLVTQFDIDITFSFLTQMEIVELRKLLPNLRSQQFQMIKKFLQFKQLMLKKYPILNLVIRSEQILRKCFVKVSNQYTQKNQNSQLPDITTTSLDLLNGDLLDDINQSQNNLVFFLAKQYFLQHINYQKKQYKKLSKSLEKFKGLAKNYCNRKRIRSCPKRYKIQSQHNNLNTPLYLPIQKNSQFVDNKCTTLFKQAAMQIKNDNQNKGEKQERSIVINIQSRKKQFEKKFKIQEKQIKMREYDIQLVAQAKFDSEVQQNQKKLMNIEVNLQKESSKLFNSFQEMKKIKDQYQQKDLNMHKNSQVNNQPYQQDEIKLKQKKELQILKRIRQNLQRMMQLINTKLNKSSMEQSVQDFVKSLQCEKKQGHGSPQIFLEIKNIKMMKNGISEIQRIRQIQTHSQRQQENYAILEQASQQ